MPGLRDALRNLPDAVFADLYESSDAYLFVFDLPGVTSDTVDVTVDDGVLAVDARRDKAVPDEFEYVREERPVFLDVEVPLPPDGTAAGSSATVESGVLEVRIPRADGEPQHVQVEG